MHNGLRTRLDLLKFSTQALERKYFEAFNFYFAKPINEILANMTLPHVILYKEFIYEDHENEYLKRYYQRHEVPMKVEALTSFYHHSFKETRPNLCLLEQHKILQKRDQKQMKIFLSKNNKAEGEKPPQTDRYHKDKPLITEDLFNEKILTSNLREDDMNNSYNARSSRMGADEEGDEEGAEEEGDEDGNMR